MTKIRLWAEEDSGARLLAGHFWILEMNHEPQVADFKAQKGRLQSTDLAYLKKILSLILITPKNRKENNEFGFQLILFLWGALFLA